ncbi:flagellar assembly protein FliW [Heliophilum fasciatum]|uniref:Flagellar assembly factor FliW n=1 Tax=Heliophilum fasciatum TaxID=35700 RepID=A0A4V2SWZ5_9FIRM|nr:flagellar assembly protein FliW [Heliophilum fasciatum]MCW2278818.1 flagellar assembly factor FliW [Heliophilum fasciatum]TCP64096.1 flagellar assembly factor FliW [Heliophilum fasciatum]
MLLTTTRFGEIDVPENHCLAFPQGIPGFPEEKSFAFLPYEPDNVFAFLQSATDPDLTFVIVNPFAFFPDYDVALHTDIVGAIGIAPENPGEIWNIVTVRTGGTEMTANLLAPIVINWLDRKAMQVVLEKTPYTTRHHLIPPKTEAEAQAIEAKMNAAPQVAEAQAAPDDAV